MSSSVPSDEDDDVFTVVSKQRRELMEAEAIESDMDLAFHLQLQEALAASLALQPSSSTTATDTATTTTTTTITQTLRYDAVPTIPSAATVVSFQSEELAKLEQELKDREQSEIEMRKAREDLNRRIHDDQVAREIMGIPDDEWEESGDFFSKPFGEGSSLSSSTPAATKMVESESGVVFRLYFKGLVSEETAAGKSEKAPAAAVAAGIGVAICDPRDNLVFEIKKPLIENGISKSGAQLKALIEGLNAALALDLKRLTFFVENLHMFKFITGKWPAKQRKIAVLVNQVKTLRGKFIVCNPSLVPRNDIKFAFQLARDAIETQSQHAQSSSCKNVKENCVICLEDTDVSQMFAVDGCLHRYCFSCMKQHVEVKLLHGMIPRCPHEGCKSDLSVESCAKFLTPKHVETMRQRLKEASIPATEKFYCPYPRCSALMSKRELLEHTKETLRGVELSGVRRCMKCRCLFCINCKVPWHKNTTCTEYKKLNPFPPEEDTKLKSLASSNLRRPCAKCNHLIELSEGCFHMTCRCGYEFCYNCGAEWKEKKATCSCPLWDEGNILYNEDDDHDEVSESESEYESDYYESDIDYHPLIHGNKYCLYCGTEWEDRWAACACPLPVVDYEDINSEEWEEDEEEDKEEGEYGSEDEDYEDKYEDEGEEVVQEGSDIGSAEDDNVFDEEYEEDEEEEEYEDEGEEVVQEGKHIVSADDDSFFEEEYEEYDDEEVQEEKHIVSAKDDNFFLMKNMRMMRKWFRKRSILCLLKIDFLMKNKEDLGRFRRMFRW